MAHSAHYVMLAEEEEPVVVGVPVQPSAPPLSLPASARAGAPVLLGRAPADHSVSDVDDVQKPAALGPTDSASRGRNAGFGRARPQPAVLPVMLPSYAIARSSPAAVSPYDHVEWILAPGPDGRPVAAIGHGAIRAGPHHAPHGSAGLAAGAVAGVLLGVAPLLVLPGIGYVTAKNVSRVRHTIGMIDELGQLVDVKLWKAGKHAPLTEEGYWLVASDPRDSEMEVFIQRVVAHMGGRVVDHHALRTFVPLHSGHLGLSSLARVRAELRAAPWVHFL